MSNKVDWKKEYYFIETKDVYRKIEVSEETNVSNLKTDTYKLSKNMYYYGKKRKQYNT